jgi:type II secretory pathway component PulJ
LKPAVADDQVQQPPAAQQETDCSTSEMIDSIVNQLAQDDRSISLDAYQTLSSVIREYDEIPEEVALKAKINTILKYIKRDLLRQVKPDEPQIADTNLITQALKVLVIVVWNREYSSLLSDEYRSFLLDRSIQVVAEHSAPKSVLIHYLHLVATQDFRQGLITSNNRIPRLLEALKALTDHVKGNGIVSERLLVYQKLLDQARAVMKAKAYLWVEELLTGMTSSLKDVRTKAMTLGTKACSAFPTSSPISIVVRSVLEKELDNERTISSAMCRRLEKMLVSKDEMSQVPQIWAIVILLSNGHDTRIEDWPELKDWLKVIQKCFNCSDSAVRQQANMAWNRLVYIVRPHEASSHLTAMLAKPLSAQLERQGIEKPVKVSRATAVSSYCNLLYYAFRPAATHKQYTQVWNEYIVKVMRSSFFVKESTTSVKLTANCDLACRVLIALLWNSNRTTKVWNENRALENTPIEPEELPTIDCKWVRARCTAIVNIFQVLLRYSSWGGSGQSDRAYIAVAWAHFLKALREASSKEIKPSQETKQAVATVIKLLGDLWTGSRTKSKDDQDQDDLLSDAQVRQMIRSAVYELGHNSILTGLESHDTSDGKSVLLLEVFDSIISDLKGVEENSEMRSHLQNSRITLQNLLSQMEKCLQLLNSSSIQDLQTGQTNTLSAFTDGFRTVQHALSSVPAPQLEQTVCSLRPVLVQLLKGPSDLVHGQANHSFGTPYRRFLQAVVTALARLPSATIAGLDDILAAPFEYTHVLTAVETSQLYEEYVDQLEDFAPGPRLTEVLRQLDNFHESGSPGAQQPAQDEEDYVLPQPLASAETSSPASSNNALASDERMEDARAPSPILGSQAHEDVISPEKDAALSSSPTPASRPRSRHDDSQIQFVAIESSPYVQDEPESQYLTLHQKEVRERQRSEPAVVFPDLRSSPRPHSRSQSHTDCEFARKAAALDERPSTPTLPVHHDQELEIMASPTPRARHFTDHITNVEVPSSPPSILDNQDKEGPDGEVPSSPFQGATEDANIRIDLALPHLGEAPEELVAEKNENVDGTGPEEAAILHEEREMAIPFSLCAGATGGPRRTETAIQPTEGRKYSALMDEVVATRTDADAPDEELVQTDSDEIDMLSASQLSQDLHRHLSQGLDGDQPLAENEPMSDELRPPEPDKSSSKQRARQTRKRKSTSLSYASAKRRKSKSSSQASSSSAASLESRPVHVEEEDGPAAAGEIVDCIEVAPSQAVQALAARHHADEAAGPSTKAPTPGRKRRRGRPRKDGRTSPSQEALLTDTIEVSAPVAATVQARHSKVEKIGENVHVDVGLQEQQDVKAVKDHYVEMEQSTTIIEVVRPRPRGEEEGRLAGDDNTALDAAVPVRPLADQADIVSSLQDVLARLQSAGPGTVDLRAVDELCFQIRFQAQVVAARQETAGR